MVFVDPSGLYAFLLQVVLVIGIRISFAPNVWTSLRRRFLQAGLSGHFPTESAPFVTHLSAFLTWMNSRWSG